MLLAAGKATNPHEKILQKCRTRFRRSKPHLPGNPVTRLTVHARVESSGTRPKLEIRGTKRQIKNSTFPTYFPKQYKQLHRANFLRPNEIAVFPKFLPSRILPRRNPIERSIIKHGETSTALSTFNVHLSSTNSCPDIQLTH